MGYHDVKSCGVVKIYLEIRRGTEIGMSLFWKLGRRGKMEREGDWRAPEELSGQGRGVVPRGKIAIARGGARTASGLEDNSPLLDAYMYQPPPVFDSWSIIRAGAGRPFRMHDVIGREI